MDEVQVTQPVPAKGSQVLADEFEEFVRGSLKRLLGRAYWLSDRQWHLAEDFVQETYLLLWRAWITSPGSIVDNEAYARRILVNVCSGYYRRKPTETPAEVIPESPADFGERQGTWQDDLRRVISGLPPQQRELIYLHYYVGLSLAEAASVMGIADKTAYNYHTLAKNRLRNLCSRGFNTAIVSSDPGRKESCEGG